MTAHSNIWMPFLEGPVFAFTADQDWAPEWAVETLLRELKRSGIPLHIFRTNPSASLDRAVKSGDAENGWHPNFLPGSTQGRTVAEILSYCKLHFPGASTVRSHCFAEDSISWRALRSAGIVADSQPCSLFQGHLLPLVHWTGIVRLPVYFEDDLFFDIEEPDLNLDTILPTLFTPGLKVLNFHPTFVGCNTPSRACHEAWKPRIFSAQPSPEGLQWGGRGNLDVMRELLERILARGYRFHRFQSLVEMAQACVEASEEVVPGSMRKRLVVADQGPGEQ